MITIPMKSKNNITYKEKLAQKTDYVIIVNDENSSNVSDLFIIWNQKAKVFISSELSDFYKYLKTNKITKKYNIIIIGSSNTEYKEIEKYYYFLKFYFTLLENKKYSNYKSLNKHVENLKLFSLVAYQKNDNLNQNMIKYLEILNTDNVLNITASFNLLSCYAKHKNFNHILELINDNIRKKYLFLELDIKNDNDMLECIETYKSFNIIPFMINLYLSMEEKEVLKISKLLEGINKYLRLKRDISNIDNLGEEKIINFHNLVFFLERKQNDINRFDNQKLTIRDVKELKNLLIISKSYKKCLEEKEKLINGIYTKIKNSRTLDKKLKETLLGFIAFIEAK